MPIAPSATLFPVRPSLCLRVARGGRERERERARERSHFASRRDSPRRGSSDRAEVRIEDARQRKRGKKERSVFLYGINLVLRYLRSRITSLCRL